MRNKVSLDVALIVEAIVDRRLPLVLAVALRVVRVGTHRPARWRRDRICEDVWTSGANAPITAPAAADVHTGLDSPWLARSVDATHTHTDAETSEQHQKQLGSKARLTDLPLSISLALKSPPLDTPAYTNHSHAEAALPPRQPWSGQVPGSSGIKAQDSVSSALSSAVGL